jgi:hypothetical protein
MSIVLAIEPDHRQAAHLTAIVRHQVGADLVLAHTTEGALDAIGNRVPDLVLVPALLSPQDDAALAAALRVIAAAAHVKTLTIPVLSSGIAQASAGGLLGKWRKSRAASPEPEGCAPAVFGEQISAYLQETAAERAALAELEDDPLESEPPPLPVQMPVHVQAPIQAPVFAGPPPIVELDVPTVDFAFSLDSEAPPEPRDIPEAVDEGEPMIDLSDELADLGGETEGELLDGEPVGVYTISGDADEPAIEPFDLLPAILEAEPLVTPVVEAVHEVAAAAVEPQYAEAARFADADPFDAPRTDITPWQPMYLTPGRLWPPMEGVPAEMPVARTEQPDWIELVASLRQDLERRRTEAPAAVADPIAARPSDGAHAETRAIVKKVNQPKKAKPVQDEWGFFDPEQCGFSTLLAKLDEITDGSAT